MAWHRPQNLQQLPCWLLPGVGDTGLHKVTCTRGSQGRLGACRDHYLTPALTGLRPGEILSAPILLSQTHSASTFPNVALPPKPTPTHPLCITTVTSCRIDLTAPSCLKSYPMFNRPASLHWLVRPSAASANGNSIFLLFSHPKPSTHPSCCRHPELLPEGPTCFFHLHSPSHSTYGHHTHREASSRRRRLDHQPHVIRTPHKEGVFKIYKMWRSPSHSDPKPKLYVALSVCVSAGLSPTSP